MISSFPFSLATSVLHRGWGGVSRLAPTYMTRIDAEHPRRRSRGPRDRSRCPRTINLHLALLEALALRVAVVVFFLGDWWSAGAMAVLGYLILRGRR